VTNEDTIILGIHLQKCTLVLWQFLLLYQHHIIMALCLGTTHETSTINVVVLTPTGDTPN